MSTNAMGWTTLQRWLGRAAQGGGRRAMAVGAWLRTLSWRRCLGSVRGLRRPLQGRGRRSLVGRLLVLLILGVVMIYFIAIAGLWWTASELIDNSLQKEALQWLAELDELGTPLYVSAHHRRQMENIAARVKHFPEIGYIRYYDASGRRILGQYSDGRVTRIPALTPAQVVDLRRLADGPNPYVVDFSGGNGGYVRVTAPLRIKAIRSDGMMDFNLNQANPERIKVIGYVDIGMDRGYYRRHFIHSILVGSLVIAGVFLLVLLLGRRLIKKALAPLLALQTPLARLAHGDTDIEVAPVGDREVVAISDALNVTISALKQRDQALRRLAEHDPLTGLVNRAYFARQVEQEVRHLARRSGSSAVLFIDLDQFKYVNDALGHAAGDRLLMQVARLLKSRLRDNDVVARFGGDEFTVLARGVGRQDAVRLARAINRMMQDFHFVEGTQAFNVYCSIGVAMIDASRYNAEEILSQADMACYQAKNRGRNGYSVHDANDTGKEQRASDIGWSQRIRDALKNDLFRLVYQPIVSIEGSDTECYEVLLRLPGRNGELISPVAFLPVAERFGLMVEIDNWVIRNALGALAEARRGGRDVVFSINLSGQVFEDGEALLKTVEESLNRYQVPAQAVIFEITEQVAVRYLHQARQVMQVLNGHGCRFALDDFGAGFSSLTYLKHLPVTFIKIVGTFVENMATDTVDQVMVQAIVHIARATGKQTIAEFVQNAETLDLLARFGADYAQGYHLAYPSERLEREPFAARRAIPAAKV